MTESNRGRAGRGPEPLRGLRAGIVLGLCSVLLAACGSAPRTVQVVDRTTPAKSGPRTAPVPATAGRESTQVIEGDTYVVKRGDTLYQIALDHGQDWRDIAQWNSLADPNHLLVGQVLRVRRAEAVAASKPADNGVAQATPLPGAAPAAPRALGTPPPAATVPVAPAPDAEKPAVARPAAPAKPDAPGERVDWGWPANGKIIETFSESRNKGLDIAGAPGDPVLAAGDGKVVYSGNGLRGYGNLIIVKHNNTYLSAYAHNRAMLVKEGQSVRRGQKIAELGQTDAESPRVHFEIRRQGRPVDPTGYLPQR